MCSAEGKPIRAEHSFESVGSRLKIKGIIVSLMVTRWNDVLERLILRVLSSVMSVLIYRQKVRWQII